MDYIKGLVSVVIPTYKRSDMLIRAIRSVLNQTYQNIELILVNDNDPNDKFTETLKNRVVDFNSDPRFKLIIQDKHINGAVARNVGIKHARGEYLAFLDDDDWWKLDKIEKQVKELSSLDKSWGVISCRIAQYDNDKLLTILPKYNDGYVYIDVLMLNCDFATGTLLFRRDYLDKSRYFDENLLRHQDYQLLVDFTSKFKLKQLNECLHCCDISDTGNRPNGDKLVIHKQKFFESVKPVVDTLDENKKKCIFAIHNFEIGYVYFREHKYIDAIKYMIKVFESIEACVIVVKKIKQKLQKNV